MPPKKPQKKWSERVTATLIALASSGLVIAGVNYFLHDSSPEIVVRQFYNSMEPKKAVPAQVGGLLIDYQPNTEKPVNEYVVQVTNEGRGPEEDVRLDIRFNGEMPIQAPNSAELRIYQPEDISWNEGSYFVNLRQFPKDAFAPLVFGITENAQKLCETKIRVAGKQKEGRVEPLKGLKCAL